MSLAYENAEHHSVHYAKQMDIQKNANHNVDADLPVTPREMSNPTKT